MGDIDAAFFARRIGVDFAETGNLAGRHARSSSVTFERARRTSIR
jgi:hypothetical protein